MKEREVPGTVAQVGQSGVVLLERIKWPGRRQWVVQVRTVRVLEIEGRVVGTRWVPGQEVEYRHPGVAERARIAAIEGLLFGGGPAGALARLREFQHGGTGHEA